MPRRVALTLLAALLLAAPALAGDIHKQKAKVDAKISSLQGKIATAQKRESSLRGQIAVVTAEGPANADLAATHAGVALEGIALSARNRPAPWKLELVSRALPSLIA